jgi:hypothetical protein
MKRFVMHWLSFRNTRHPHCLVCRQGRQALIVIHTMKLQPSQSFLRGRFIVGVIMFNLVSACQRLHHRTLAMLSSHVAAAALQPEVAAVRAPLRERKGLRTTTRRASQATSRAPKPKTTATSPTRKLASGPRKRHRSSRNARPRSLHLGLQLQRASRQPDGRLRASSASRQQRIRFASVLAIVAAALGA